MIPSPTNPTGSPKSATSRCFDPQTLTGPQATARLGRQVLAVEQVAAAFAWLASLRARRRVPAPLRQQGEAHVGAGLDLPHHAVAAAEPPGAARAAPDGVADDPQRELELERLDRRVE